MALSNIGREPQREITESVAGLVVFGVFAWADYRFASWLYEATGGSANNGCPWPIGMLFGLCLGMMCVGVLFLTHSLGEAVCAGLDSIGIRLRPKNRK